MLPIVIGIRATGFRAYFKKQKSSGMMKARRLTRIHLPYENPLLGILYHSPLEGEDLSLKGVIYSSTVIIHLHHPSTESPKKEIRKKK